MSRLIEILEEQTELSKIANLLSEQVAKCRLTTNMDELTGSMTFMLIILFIIFLHFRRLTFSWLCIDNKRMCPYIKSSIREFLAFFH